MKTNLETSLSIRRSLLVVACAIVIACGGGSTVPGVGGQGTGTSGEQSGAVTGLGSVLVEGTRYDEDALTVRQLEIDPANPSSLSAAAVKVGMLTQLNFDSAQLITQLRVTPTLIGSIERKSADSLVVAGQTVRLLTSGALPVVFDGLADLSELASGDRIEVHGHLDPNGQILATRLERLDRTATVQTRLTGLISALENGGQTLRIGELAVDLGPATAVRPVGSTFSVGQRAVVWANVAPTAGRLTARTVALDAPAGTTSSLRVGGIVRNFERSSNRFRIGALAVDASATVSYQNGSASDLADGKVLRVLGVASNGLLKATEIKFQRDAADAAVELTGVVTDLLSSASFRIRNVTVDASAAATVFRNGSTANLTNGALVKVEGAIVQGTVRAERLEFIVTDDRRAQSYRGQIAGFDALSGLFQLLGVPMRLADGARLVSNTGALLPRNSFANGQTATVGGSFVAGVFIVTDVELRQDSAAEVVRAEGLAYLVFPLLQTFRVNGLLVRWTAATRIDGSLSDLGGGVTVRVEGTILGGELLATRITVRP